MHFCNGIIELYGEEYLRRPTQTDVEKLGLNVHKHIVLNSVGVIPGSNNDVNVLRQSPVLNDLKVGKAPEVPFVANDMTYKWGYYLTDGTYPEWAVLMKSISQSGSNDMKRIRYKQAYEAAKKDVERAFGMLKKKWVIAISGKYYPEEKHREDDPVRSAQDRLRVIREIHDEETHLSLKADLVEHIWHRTNAH
ncbi:hypothetical protein Tco_0037303 [Tanacetum coccineum]